MAEAKENAEEIAETANINATNIAIDINEMSSRGGEASGAAAPGRGGDGRRER